MPQTPHTEHHFTASETIRDIVIGMSDGLTVPFALTAGLSGAVNTTHVVVIAGLAEIAAGAIAMGLGGYLAARSDADHYTSEQQRERDEVKTKTQAEIEETEAIFRSYGLSKEQIAPIIAAMRANPEAWVDFMMRFELGLEKPASGRALFSSTTIGMSYVFGGLIPLLPYFFIPALRPALFWSIAVTVAALFVFGFFKGRFTGQNPFRSGFQTMFVGGLAAAAAFGLARLISR
ncbi:MAG TPA: VIT1/CCC1 transporter family protein [Candidatus Eremiobacteraceae bacterium]|nr:VIT1/CCC1 transporter family protein [Candidatus Eremiobacteraceae bacterium]